MNTINSENAPRTWAILKKRNNPFVWFLILAAAYLFLPSMLMAPMFMNVRSVQVLPMENGEPIEVLVDRTIHRSFEGTFTVTIRSEDGAPVCRGEPEDNFHYHPGFELPIPLYLSRWMGGKNNIETCLNAGFSDGRFYLDSCHTVLFSIYNIRFARRCVKSNVFTVSDDGQTITVDEEI